MIFRRNKKLLLWAGGMLLAGVALSTLSCTNIGYYARCTEGQINILAQRRPITGLIREPDLSRELKDRLENVLRIRDFASRELLLPENGSYRSYVDVKRPYVVWNVVATPEFDLKPLQWCFPVAGCVNYRGFFSPEEAGDFAADLRRQGNDVYLYGVTAYSTLGWFDDPVLNTFFTRSEEDLAGLIFHELAHQKVYVKNDSAFNESFAKTVEMEGVTRWLKANGQPERIRSYLEGKQRNNQFIDLVMDYRNRLRELYARPLDADHKRREKAAMFQELRTSYAALKASWGGYQGYDRWFAELNNAKIASINTYHTYVPAFRALLRQSGGNLAIFYQEVEKLGRLPRERRLARLNELGRGPLASLPPAGDRLILGQASARQ